MILLFLPTIDYWIQEKTIDAQLWSKCAQKRTF